MDWLISEVFSPAKAIGEMLAGAYNDGEVPVGVHRQVLIGDTLYAATKGVVFQGCCQKELAQMIAGLERADLELSNLPSDVATEIQNLQRIVNGSVGAISFYDGAMYYASTDIGGCGRRGWSAVIRHIKGVPFPSAEAAPETSELTPPAPDEAGAALSPAAAAILCEDFIQAVDEYFQWHKLIPPPHQVGTLEGVLIGDFGATAGDFEARRIRAAVWVRDNGPALAAALERHDFDSLPILQMVGFIDDPDAVPSTFLPLWKDTKATLQQAAIQLHNEPAPPATKPKQGEGAGNAGSVPSTHARKVRNFHTDPPETIHELIFLWLRTSEYHKDKDPWVADLIREAIRKASGGPKIENCCLVRFGEFTFTTAQRLLAEVALGRGQTFADYLPLAVSTVANYLPDPPPTGTPKRGEGNGGAGLLAGELPHATPKQGQGHIDQARSWLQSRFLEATEKTKSHDVIRVYEPGGVSRSARDEERYFLAVPREEFHAYLLSIGAPVAETIRLCQVAGWITVREGGFDIRNLQSFYAIMPAVMANSTPPGTMPNR